MSWTPRSSDPRQDVVMHISGALVARGVHEELTPHLNECPECIVCEMGTDTLILVDAIACGALGKNRAALHLADLRTEAINAADMVLAEIRECGLLLTEKQAELAERLAAYHAAGSDRPAP